MDRNVGASFTLSVLTVLFFAVVLYQPDPPAGEPAAGPRAEGAVTAEPVQVVEAHDPDVPPVAQPVARPQPRPEPPAPRSIEREAVATARATPAPRPPAQSAVRVAPAVEPAPTPRTAPSHADAVPIASATPTGAPAVVEAPRGAFTVVRPGESLREVARRVYGSEEAAEGLWKANRDLIDEAEGPLTPGALLRTP